MTQQTQSSGLTEVVDRAAEEGLGHVQLRPGQEEATAAVLEGRDTLAVMPTGAGKFAIYQIADSLILCAAIVKSPLIALPQDQVGAIALRLVGFTMLEGWEQGMRQGPAHDAA